MLVTLKVRQLERKASKAYKVYFILQEEVTLQCNWEQVLYYKYLMYNDTYIETFTVNSHVVHDLIQNQTKPCFWCAYSWALRNICWLYGLLMILSVYLFDIFNTWRFWRILWIENAHTWFSNVHLIYLISVAKLALRCSQVLFSHQTESNF